MVRVAARVLVGIRVKGSRSGLEGSGERIRGLESMPREASSARRCAAYLVGIGVGVGVRVRVRVRVGVRVGVGSGPGLGGARRTVPRASHDRARTAARCRESRGSCAPRGASLYMGG